MNDETDSTDIRTRDLAARQRQIMEGDYTHRFNDDLKPAVTMQAHPRRIDWYRIAALTIVILAACAATVALVAALVLVLTAL